MQRGATSVAIACERHFNTAATSGQEMLGVLARGATAGRRGTRVMSSTDPKALRPSDSLVIQTERLVLRELRPDDTDLLLEIFSDPIAMKYYPGTKSRSETRSWISRNLSSYREHGYGMWATFSSSTGEFVGQVGLTLQEVEGHAETELGYLLVREFWGRGIASEAARACRDFAFEKLGKSHLV